MVHWLQAEVHYQNLMDVLEVLLCMVQVQLAYGCLALDHFLHILFSKT